MSHGPIFTEDWESWIVVIFSIIILFIFAPWVFALDLWLVIIIVGFTVMAVYLLLFFIQLKKRKTYRRKRTFHHRRRRRPKHHYLIEFRFHGYAKKYAKRVIFDVSKKFGVKGVTKKRVVPHITMYGPFTTSNYRNIATRVESVAKNYDLVSFRVKGFNYFDNERNKVIYLDIEPSEELKNLRYDLSQELRKVSKTKSFEDKKSKDDFYFHATVAFKDIDRKFDRIRKYIKSKEEPNIHQHLVRITILKGRRILYEYDLMQKKMLNRNQALNHQLYQKTIRMLKKKQSKNGFKDNN